MEARDLGDAHYALGVPMLEFSSNSVELLQSFDAEVVACHQEAKKVGGPLTVVRRESAERARDEAGHAHEQALVAACRLWEASAVDSFGHRARAIDRIRQELTNVGEVKISSSSVQPAVGDGPMRAPSEVERRKLSKVSGGKDWSEESKDERLPMAKDKVARDTVNSEQQVIMAQLGKGTRAAHVASNDGRLQEKESVSDVKVTTGTPPPDVPVAAEAEMGQNVTSGASTVGTEINLNVGQSFVSMDAADAIIVRDTTAIRSSITPSLDKPGTRHVGGGELSRVDRQPDFMVADTSSLEVVVDGSSSYVDVEVEVEDDLSDPVRVGLKFLDVSALLIEKVIFVGLPTLVSGGSLVWERVDNAINGAQGRKGWKLLTRLKKDSVGYDDTAV